MTTPSRCFNGLRLAALASVLTVSAGVLRAEGKEKPEVPSGILKKYDRNKDGALDEKEAAKWEADKAERREKDARKRAAMLEKFDLNKDGKLSEEETAAAKLGMQKERTAQDMEKGKEKAGERIAREQAEKEKLEQETLARQAAEKAAAEAPAASAAKPENASGNAEPKGPQEGKTKDGEEKAEDGMMMK